MSRILWLTIAVLISLVFQLLTPNAIFFAKVGMALLSAVALFFMFKAAEKFEFETTSGTLAGGKNARQGIALAVALAFIAFALITTEQMVGISCEGIAVSGISGICGSVFMKKLKMLRLAFGILLVMTVYTGVRIALLSAWTGTIWDWMFLVTMMMWTGIVGVVAFFVHNDIAHPMIRRLHKSELRPQNESEPAGETV